MEDGLPFPCQLPRPPSPSACQLLPSPGGGNAAAPARSRTSPRAKRALCVPVPGGPGVLRGPRCKAKLLGRTPFSPREVSPCRSSPECRHASWAERTLGARFWCSPTPVLSFGTSLGSGCRAVWLLCPVEASPGWHRRESGSCSDVCASARRGLSALRRAPRSHWANAPLWSSFFY